MQGQEQNMAALQQANPHQIPPQMLALTGFAPVAPRSMTICSVHFREKRLRFSHSGRRWFVLPAADRGKYTTLDFYDSQQTIQIIPNPEQEDREAVPMPVSVESIAQDLIANWCSGYAGATASHPPGIGLIAGKIPTKDELDRLMRQEELHCRALVEEGDRIEKGTQDPFGAKRIGNDHRDALSWLGSERRSWFRPIEMGTEKTSVITGKRIPQEALADDGIDILEYYVKYDLDPMSYGDLHVSELFKSKPELKAKIQRRLGITAMPGNPNKTQ